MEYLSGVTLCPCVTPFSGWREGSTEHWPADGLWGPIQLATCKSLNAGLIAFSIIRATKLNIDGIKKKKKNVLLFVNYVFVLSSILQAGGLVNKNVQVCFTVVSTECERRLIIMC